jgi:hypothetical protein
LQVETVNCIWSAAVPVAADQKPGYVCLDFTAFFAALAFSGRTTGQAGTLRGFASKSASFAPAAPPVSGVRRMGLVINANLRKKSQQSSARHLTEKFYWLSSNAVVSKLSNLKLNSLNSLWTYIILS